MLLASRKPFANRDVPEEVFVVVPGSVSEAISVASSVSLSGFEDEPELQLVRTSAEIGGQVLQRHIGD